MAYFNIINCKMVNPPKIKYQINAVHLNSLFIKKILNQMFIFTKSYTAQN